MVLSGEALLELARGEVPSHFEAHSSLSLDEVLTLSPRAVATNPGLGIAMLPTAAGPVDIRTGLAPEEAMGKATRAGFSVLAMCIDVSTGAFRDEHHGLEDLARGRLRWVKEGTIPDTGSAFTAARLISQYDLSPDFDLDAGSVSDRRNLSDLSSLDLRCGLRKILLGPNVSGGLRALRRLGLERLILPGARSDAAAVVGLLPPDLILRTAAWMRGADVRHALRRTRMGVNFGNDLYRLLDHHPIDATARELGEHLRHRLFKRLSEREVEQLFQWRGVEISALFEAGETQHANDAATNVERLRDEFDRWREKQVVDAHRKALAISGREIMDAVGCDPGPIVGRALVFLRDCVDREPSCNTPDALRAHLDTWWREQ